MSSEPQSIWRAVKYLRNHGILVLFVPPVKGSSIDGGALILDGMPVIGISARLDRLDNFWFTLFHEVAHIELHLTVGLENGFIDDFGESGSKHLPDIEKQADDYAYGIVQPKDLWEKSLASKVTEDGIDIVNASAKKLKVHPAILFGRIRYERNNYRIFNNQLGKSEVRSKLEQLRSEGEL